MRRLLVTLTAVAVFAASANAGFLLDFGNAISDPAVPGVPDQWTAGNLTNTITAHDAGAGQTAAVQFGFSDPDGVLVSQDNDAFSLSPGTATPYVESTGVSGFSGIEALIWRIEAPAVVGGPDNGIQPVALTITFPQDVTNLQFSVGDLDVGARNVNGAPRFWQDMVTVTGANEANAAVPVSGSIVNGARVVSAGAGIFKGNASLPNPTDIPDTSDQGNVDFTFAGGVQSVTILFQPGPDVGEISETQWISLSDMTFDIAAEAIPEPSSFAFMGMLAVGIVGYRRNRRMKTAE